MSPSLTGSGAMARVSKDNVDQRFTAKDLLGAAVYDTAGERIGDIADIDLQGTVPSSLSMSFTQNDSGGVSMGSSSMSPGTNYANTGTGATSGNAGVSGSTGVAGQTGSAGNYAQSGTSSSTSQSSIDRAHSAASDVLADSSRAISSISGSSQATVFLSVGGLWGIGDDLVRVPISQLSYNTGEDRFELAASKAQVVALAEQKDGAQAGYAGSMNSGSTTAAKQTFGDEASRVQSALRTDPQVSAFAQGVTVNSDGDTIELHGSVQTEEQKKQILDAARRATSKDIEDELDVRD